jgi:hypothetical protein
VAMAGKITSEWFKKEKIMFEQSILALFASLLLATNLKTFSLRGQPCSLEISLGLFIFCILFRIKNHLAEPRLDKFYNDFLKNLKTVRKKSIEQITDELYLYLSYFLCVSIIHFYLFLITFLFYLILDEYFNITYLIHQKKKNPEWGNGKFDPVSLFISWIGISGFEIILIVVSFFLILAKKIDFNLAAYFFIALILIIEIAYDWFGRNIGFYLDYFGKEVSTGKS